MRANYNEQSMNGGAWVITEPGLIPRYASCIKRMDVKCMLDFSILCNWGRAHKRLKC